MRNRMKAMAIIPAAMVALLVAGCSSGSASSSSAPSAPGSADSVRSEAQARLDKYLVAPASLPYSTPLTKKPPAGKRVAVMDCTLGTCVPWADAVIAAGEALGWKMTRIPTGLTPQTITAAWNQVVRDKPDAVVNIASPRVLFARQAAELEAAGVPIVSDAVGEEPGDGVIADIARRSEEGRIQADKVLAELGTTANAVFVYSPEYTTGEANLADFRTEYSSLCASCKLSSFKISAADSGNGKSTTEMVGYLRANPDVNAIALGYDAIVGALPPAMKAARLVGKVSVVGLSPGAPAIGYIREGSVWKGSVQFPLIEEAWQCIDILARTFVGDPIAPADLTIQRLFVQKDNLPASAQGLFSYVPDYQAAFKKMWLVS